MHLKNPLVPLILIIRKVAEITGLANPQGLSASFAGSALCSDVGNNADAYRRTLRTHILLLAEMFLLAYLLCFSGDHQAWVFPAPTLGLKSLEGGGSSFYYLSLVTGLTVSKCWMNKSML